MTAHPTLQDAAHREPTADGTPAGAAPRAAPRADGRPFPAPNARNPIISLAQRFDPRPGDEARYETAIARRNTAWANYREAADLLEAARARGYTDLTAWVQNYNDAQHDYEHAATDLIRERVRWLAAGVPWL